MIDRLMASLSETPRYRKGMRAFDVAFRTSVVAPDEKRDRHIVLLTTCSEHLGQHIREGLYDLHPDAVDYSFTEFDYRLFQGRVAVRSLVEVMSQGMEFTDGLRTSRLGGEVDY